MGTIASYHSIHPWFPCGIYTHLDVVLCACLVCQVPSSKFTFLFEVDGELRVSENEMYEPRPSEHKPLSEVSPAGAGRGLFG